MSSEPPDHIREARAVWEQPQEQAQPHGVAPDGPLPGSTWHPHGAAAPQQAQYLQPYASAGYPQQVYARAQGNGMAVASLVLGITSILFCWWGLLTLAQIVLAIVFGVKGIRRAEMGAGSKNLAVAGLVCGCVGAVAYLFIGIATVGFGFII